MGGQQSQGPARLLSYCCSTEACRDVLVLITVTSALLIYGVLQERIVTVGFGPEKEIFQHSIFLVLCNRCFTCTLCLAYLLCCKVNAGPTAPLHSYGAVSLTNVIATSCQYEALKYVSFAVQTLAKSAKALPVMLWGTVFIGKRYNPIDYLHASTIMLGCTIFILTGDVTSRIAPSSDDMTTVCIGIGLMVLYLAVDGLTSTWQDSLFHGYDMDIFDQVFYTTACSTVLSLLGTIATQQLVPAVLFISRYPQAALWITALSLASAVVQLVISYTIKRYGAVMFATIMTTRQFFSILLSSAIFMTPLTQGQWLGTLLVFAAIYYKAVQKCSTATRQTPPLLPVASPRKDKTDTVSSKVSNTLLSPEFEEMMNPLLEHRFDKVPA